MSANDRGWSRPHSLPPVAQTPPQLYCQLAAAGFDRAELRRLRDASLLAVGKTNGLVRGSGKPFSCHLVGVASLVAECVPGDAVLVVAALLHALYQPRVAAPGDSGDPRAEMVEAFGPEVDELVHAYQSLGPLTAEQGLLGATVAPLERRARILHLADQLEDGLDGGPWWHGGEQDRGDERGCARQRVDQFLALRGLFEQAPALSAPRLLQRYLAICDDWQVGTWPADLRSGRYSSFRVG